MHHPPTVAEIIIPMPLKHVENPKAEPRFSFGVTEESNFWSNGCAPPANMYSIVRDAPNCHRLSHAP